MYSILFYFVFLFSLNATAQEVLEEESYSPDDYIELQAPLSGWMEKSDAAKTYEEYNKKFNDDELIALYLKTPYKKRQYIFPMIHVGDYVSHKIKTHPEIIIWKNKKPTDIAPQLKEFAKKHLNNLSPLLYTYLDPDFWKEIEAEKIIKSPYINPDLYFKNNETIEYSSPTIQALFKLSNKKADDYFKTTLTQDDIFNLSNIMAHLDTYQPITVEKKDFTTTIFRIYQNLVHRALGDPFKMFVLALEQIGEKENFEQFIKQYGYTSLDEFADKNDKIIKAYKVLSLPLPIAIQINHLKYNEPVNPVVKEDLNKEDISPSAMITRLYTATPGDVYFVKKHQEQVKSLMNSKFADFGIMFFVD